LERYVVNLRIESIQKYRTIESFGGTC
jgi:hypothetical protein